MKLFRIFNVFSLRLYVNFTAVAKLLITLMEPPVMPVNILQNSFSRI